MIPPIVFDMREGSANYQMRPFWPVDGSKQKFYNSTKTSMCFGKLTCHWARAEEKARQVNLPLVLKGLKKNSTTEERVKNFKHNSENLMKIGWKIRKLWHLKFRKFSRNISWPVDMNMQMSEVMMSSPHNFSFILYTEMKKKKKKNHISAMRMLDLPLIPLWNRCSIMLTPIYLDMRDILSQVWAKYQNFSKFYVQNRWWHHQLTHLHIHIDWSRNVLWKFAKLQSVITSFFTVMFEKIYSFFWD